MSDGPRTWLVETLPDAFDTVRAHGFRIDNGCLVFLDFYDKPTYALSAGRWLSVCEDV